MKIIVKALQTLISLTIFNNCLTKKKINMEKVINGRRYSTDSAIEVASDYYWDGHNYSKHGRNTYLLKSKLGNFFLYKTSQCMSELDSITPLTRERAMQMYEELPESKLSYKDAFGLEPPDA
jgi:hypothetical protein